METGFLEAGYVFNTPSMVWGLWTSSTWKTVRNAGSWATSWTDQISNCYLAKISHKSQKYLCLAKFNSLLTSLTFQTQNLLPTQPLDLSSKAVTQEVLWTLPLIPILFHQDINSKKSTYKKGFLIPDQHHALPPSWNYLWTSYFWFFKAQITINQWPNRTIV